MELEQVHGVIKGIPVMSFDQAAELTSFIKRQKLNNILELGFAHGVSSCYIAGILDEMQTGHLTTMNQNLHEIENQNIESLLSKLKLSSYVYNLL